MPKGLEWGYLLGLVMAIEPSDKRAIAFIDGQNLYHAARTAFGYSHPNYDVRLLAESVCRLSGWRLVQTRFYTGVPAPTKALHSQDDLTKMHVNHAISTLERKIGVRK